MHFDDYAAAREYLVKAASKPELGGLEPKPGISQGTALYYLGLAWERLGPLYAKEAAASYGEAARAKEATLFNNDGPSVAPLAQRRSGAPTP